MFLLSLYEKFTNVFIILSIIKFYKEHCAHPEMLEVKSTSYISFLPIS